MTSTSIARTPLWCGFILQQWMARWIRHLVLPALALVLGLPLMLAPLAPMPAAAATVPVTVALDVGNVYGLSTRDKTYRAEGILRVSAPAAAVRQWVAAGVEPSELVRFDNLVEPWNSLLEPNGPLLQLGASLGRDYRFSGNFYSDEINFRSHPFGGLTLRLILEAVPSANGAVRAYPYDAHLPEMGLRLANIQLRGDAADSSVNQRTNMTGYQLRSWRLVNEPHGVELNLTYEPLGRASLMKWLLPLTITMLVMLLTPNLRASFSSERLAIPPVILLTLVFMQQAYRDTLPTLPYLTGLDRLYALSYGVTLVFFCEFIWCANLKDRLAERFDAALNRRIEHLELTMQLVSVGCFLAVLIWAWGLS
jgi:hypothetical protein